MTGMIVTIFTILVTGVVLTLSLLSMGKRSNKVLGGSLMDPLSQGSRHRDGATTYSQFEGRRYNVELEDPRGLPGARYRRRHPAKQHKSTKPWQK